MKFRVTVFKDTGKFYAEDIVECETVPVYREEFKKVLKKNLPADIGEGFVVINDEGFEEHNNNLLYNALYRYYEL